MKVKKEKKGKVLNVAINGELNVKTAPQLNDELDGELDDVTEVCFDLEDCPYSSSAGLRVILGAYQTMEEKGGCVILKNVNEILYNILEEVSFMDYMEVRMSD